MTLTIPPGQPVAARKPVRLRRHGVSWTDDYAWLRDSDWQRVMREPESLDPEIRHYLEAENAYAERALAPLRDLSDALVAEMRGRMENADSSVPARHGPYAYYSRYDEGAEHPLYCRSPTDSDGPEEVLLDGNVEAAGHTFFQLGSVEHSPDHRRLAYAVDVKGSELYELHIREATTGQDLPDIVTAIAPNFAWSADGGSLFYTAVDVNMRPLKVMRHIVGTPQAQDATVYDESDPGFYVYLYRSQSGRFIVVVSHNHEVYELRLVEAADPEAAPRIVVPRDRGLEYLVEDHEDRLIMRINAGGAEDFKIVETPIDALDEENWTDIVAHEKGRVIVSHTVFRDHLIVLSRRESLPQIEVREFSTGQSHMLEFDEEAYSLALLPGYEYETQTLRFTYSSMATPRQVIDYDIVSGNKVLRKQQKIPSGHNPTDYIVRRLFARAADGAAIPISLLQRRDRTPGSDCPLFLYGYGAYGINIPADFGVNRLSLVDRGFVYAIAHIRGGKDKGQHWYEGGRREHKRNTFDDYLAVARHLISEGYAAPKRIVAMGRSAGGLLMGVIANEASALFAAIIAEVPFVDCLNTMLDEGLPLTPAEFAEWGNPIIDEDAFELIRSYSPYDNVRPQDYPHMLLTAGLTDPRVTYWEPAKWMAKLRRCNKAQSLLVLKTNMTAGHAGSSGRYGRLDEVAEGYAFALAAVGAAQ